ncbi:MAG: hypothetical protein NTW72_11780, partial [Gemmatimonadetes bacterium]|nr:hypothetical protein [Gemmatimonadota bacterium]
KFSTFKHECDEIIASRGGGTPPFGDLSQLVVELGAAKKIVFKTEKMLNQIIVDMRNLTYEHIAVGTFVKDLDRAFVNSGVVRVVASKEERAGIRDERADQQSNAAPETRTRMAREQGAQYLLQGEVQEIVDGAGREQVRYFQVDASLVDLESNAKVWVGQHKIKKYVQRRHLTP